MPDAIRIFGAILAGLVALFLVYLLAQFMILYVQALRNGVKVELIEMFGMRLRKVSVRSVVNAAIRAKEAGLELSISQIETHDLAGGRVHAVVNALITARKAHIPLTWDIATAIDLAGRDVELAVETGIKTRAFDRPSQNDPHFTALDRLMKLSRPLGSAEDANEWQGALDASRSRPGPS